MLHTNNTRVRMIALIAFIILLGAGAVTAHAQVARYQVQAHPAADITVIYTPFGPREVVVPCVH